MFGQRILNSTATAARGMARLRARGRASFDGLPLLIGYRELQSIRKPSKRTTERGTNMQFDRIGPAVRKGRASTRAQGHLNAANPVQKLRSANPNAAASWRIIVVSKSRVAPLAIRPGKDLSGEIGRPVSVAEGRVLKVLCARAKSEVEADDGPRIV